MLLVIVLLAIIIGVLYLFIIIKKNELTEIPEIAALKEKPVMPAIDTSAFLTLEKDVLSNEGEKIGDFTIEDLAYPNYHRGYFMKEHNVFIVISQNIPNVIQKYLGLFDVPYISIYSIFDDGSDLESTTRKNKFQENKSTYRGVEIYDDLPVFSIIGKHKIRIDLIEAKGPTALDLQSDAFFKYMTRGLKVDIVHKSTKGYETKSDIEKIMRQLDLGQEKKEEKEDMNNNQNEETI